MSTSSTGLTQQQQLRQRLLPQQVQFARMLEQTDREVEEEVKRELEENPALEQVDDGTDRMEPLSRYYHNPQRQADSDAPDPGSLAVARAATLPEMLSAQLAEQDLSPRIRRLAEFMTWSLDTNGYFTRTLPQMATDAAMSGLPEPTAEEVREAWRVIRSLDPPGVGAMDLRDCLLLQLVRMPDDTPYVEQAREVIRHYFDLFSNRNFTRLAEESGISPEALRKVNDLILRLNPKPASSISAESDTALTGGVSPDFIVEVEGDSVSVSMPSNIPDLMVEKSFVLADDAPHTEATDFIRQCADDARTFIDMLSRRRRTLLAIVSAIVRIQAEFFKNGDDESLIRPMVLRNVAEATGYDVSTVSRATAGKWLATQFGVYPLKIFFNEAVADSSAHQVVADLRAIIEAEDPSNPLGDDAIMEKLTAEYGHKLARRTVAKYRDKLGIPPARLRRRI